ncbi:MAG: choice-of-anchor Q domain-containing protein [Anaerolineae bacterium]
MFNLLKRSRFLLPIAIATLFSISMLSFVFFPQPAAALPPGTIFVDKDATSGGDTGADWANAYTDLQTALATAVSGDQIWVASGVYTPGATPEDTFVLTDGVAIYGGFSATETLLSERDWESNVTVLSGDIDGDDTADSYGVVVTFTHQVGDNNYNVVTGSGVTNTAVLDGFVVTAGQADEEAVVIPLRSMAAALLENGGGMYNDTGSPTVANVSFMGNLAVGEGGGMYNSESNAALKNVTFSGNGASLGGGMANSFGIPTLEDVTLSGNFADDAGGGIFNADSDPILNSLIISGNIAGDVGGGIFNGGSRPTLNNVTMNGNIAGAAGGGMYNVASNPTLEDVTISGNIAGDAGGGVHQIMGSLVLSNTILSGNSAASHGGGIYLENGSITMTQSVIENNTATLSGGGLYGIYASIYSINSTTISGNVAEEVRGGGLYIREGAVANVVNSTISGNRAEGQNGSITDGGNGGGIYVGGPVASRLTLNHVTVTNNDAAGNGGGIDFNRSAPGDLLALSNSIVAGNTDTGGFPDCHDYGTGNYTFNVNNHNLFGGTAGDSCAPETNDFSLTDLGMTITDTLAPLADNGGLAAGSSVSTTLATTATIQTHALIKGSPAIDAGASVLTTDQRGYTRPFGPERDIGAYEFILSCPTDSPVFVNHAATGLDNGSSWNDAFASLQDALYLDAACLDAVDEIWVASGVYTPGAFITDTFVLTSGVAIYGGFAATETLLSERDWEANVTVLSGDVDGDDTTDSNGVVVTATHQVGENSEHVVLSLGVDNTAVLDGFTVTAGMAIGDESPDYGGGLFNVGGSPTLNNLHFAGNLAFLGGGMYSYFTDDTPIVVPVSEPLSDTWNRTAQNLSVTNSSNEPTLNNVIFSGNLAVAGGGMFNEMSSPMLTHVTFEKNLAAADGGGMLNVYESHPILTNVVFSENKADGDGGGMFNADESFPILVNVIFEGNSAGNDGGGVYNLGLGALPRSSQSALATSPTFINVSFTSNFAGDDGGGMANVVDFGCCRSPKNSAAVNTGNSSPILMNVTFSGNRALDKAGGLYNKDDSNPTIINSIFWNNQDASGVGTLDANLQNNLSDPSINYSLVQGSGGSSSWDSLAGTDGGNNIDVDPLFKVPVNPSSAPLVAGNVQLQLTSPAIDVGNTSAYTGTTTTTTDLAGHNRIFNSIIDLGAFEAPSYDIAIDLPDVGGGIVRGFSTDCAIDCAETFLAGTVVTLTAVADPYYIFTGWSGACSGTGDCTITVTADITVGANFALLQYALTTVTAGTGTGSITASPANSPLDHGTVVTLTATADPGSTFDGWSGDCMGIGSCQITMDGAKNVTATFTLIPLPDPINLLHLPMVSENFPTRDLVVESISVMADDVQVVVKNIGNGPIIDTFWVDLYVNPTTPPTAVNEVWFKQGSDGGAVWGVFDTILAAGESLTLTLSSGSLDPGRSNLSSGIPSGSAVYVQVDAANLNSPDGSVVEIHEILDLPYNNISMITTTTAFTYSGTLTQRRTFQADKADLPAR